MLLRLTLYFSHPSDYEQESSIVENGLKNENGLELVKEGFLPIWELKENITFCSLAEGTTYYGLSPSLQEDTDFIFSEVNSRFYCGNPRSWNL